MISLLYLLWKLIATNLNLIHARNVFPCFDKPSKSAVFKVVIYQARMYLYARNVFPCFDELSKEPCSKWSSIIHICLHSSFNMFKSPCLLLHRWFLYYDYFSPRKLIATNLNPIHARNVFPCFDEPSKRAVFNLVINHPPIYTNVLFNTRRVSRSFAPGSNQWVRDTFESTPPLPPHLLAIFIADRSYAQEAITLGSRHSVST